MLPAMPDSRDASGPMSALWAAGAAASASSAASQPQPQLRAGVGTVGLRARQGDFLWLQLVELFALALARVPCCTLLLDVPCDRHLFLWCALPEIAGKSDGAWHEHFGRNRCHDGLCVVRRARQRLLCVVA